MREVVFKNLYFPKSQKRSICIQETFSKDGFLSKTVKKSTYFIRSIRHIEDRDEFEKWMKARKGTFLDGKKRFHILKKHSDKENRDKVFCKALGTLYAIVGKNIYNIVFVHSLNLEMKKIQDKKAV